jgi:hypothetical protein
LINFTNAALWGGGRGSFIFRLVGGTGFALADISATVTQILEVS